MKRLYRLYGLADEQHPAAALTVLAVSPILFAVAWAFMAGWL